MILEITSSSISTPGEEVVAPRGGKVRLSLSFVTLDMLSASPTNEVVTGAGVVVGKASETAADGASESDL